MRSWTQRRHHTRPVRGRLRVEHLEDRSLLSTGFVETPLVSNIPGFAPHNDPDLINAWGFFVTPQGQFRVAANGAGNAPLITARGMVTGPAIDLPPPPGSPHGTTSAPNGAIPNPTGDFVISFKKRSAPAAALFSTEDGTILGWNPQLSQRFGVVAADQSSVAAVYKGLDMGSAGGANYLYATNFRSGTVDVFDTNFALHTFFPGQFTDPSAPAGFAPFGIKNIDGVLFVSYAEQDAARHDDVAGPGNGFIDEFDTSGHFLMRFASGTAAGGTLTELNSPFGMTVAPAGFGDFGGALLVGNFGDSHVSAFDLTTGQFLGQLQDTNGQPLVLDAGITGSDGNTKGLWGIAFGNGQGGAGTQTLFFATGPNDESDGVFGMVQAAPQAGGPDRLEQALGRLTGALAHSSNPAVAMLGADLLRALQGGLLGGASRAAAPAAARADAVVRGGSDDRQVLARVENFVRGDAVVRELARHGQAPAVHAVENLLDNLFARGLSF
jgi:uncharacterized protein (TIGR03118 family)